MCTSEKPGYFKKIPNSNKSCLSSETLQASNGTKERHNPDPKRNTFPTENFVARKVLIYKLR